MNTYFYRCTYKNNGGIIALSGCYDTKKKGIAAYEEFSYTFPNCDDVKKITDKHNIINPLDFSVESFNLI